MKSYFRILLVCILGSGLVGAVVEPPLPQWDAEERARMGDEGWIAGSLLLTYEPLPLDDEEKEAALAVLEAAGEPVEEEVDENEISEEFLGAYFEGRPDGFVIDPQSLLSSREKNDLEEFLSYHASDSSIDLHLYVFGAEQVIPSDVREEEVVERLYSSGKPSVVIYYYLGAPQRSNIYLSPILTDAVSAAEQRRAMESSVIQAFASASPFEQLNAFLVQMSIRIYWMERMQEREEVASEEVSADEMLGDDAEEKEESGAKFVMPLWAKITGGFLAVLGGGALTLWSMLLWYQSRRRFVFPQFEVEPRLGGEHAAGIGAVISFSNAALPPARQRDQVPDYMRRA